MIFASETALTPGASICFEVSAGEDLGEDFDSPLENASVDPLTVTMASYCSDTVRFRRSCSNGSKPSGTVAHKARTGIVVVLFRIAHGNSIRATMKRKLG
ncbi:uncharacterized protein V1516DRAFT_680037 [Lipomyces oligophaga]|uniref:uncharacterized protein n=1 Tax=Lipomyces oligophaga TaxID=45792 RepID=UPI0034CE0F85